MTDNCVQQRHDTIPSAFDRPITSDTQGTHDVKRVKLTEKPEETTIASLINAKTYSTIEDVVRDVNTAISGIVDELNEAVNGGEATWVTIQEKQAEIVRAATLKRELDKLVRIEMFRRPDILKISPKEEPPEEFDAKAKLDKLGDNVLTLLADSRPPKQLFSSIRKAGSLSQPLSEVALPNGITTTRIIPKHSINDKEDGPGPTLKEVFPPPASLPTLAIPKQSKHTVTKSSSVGWYNPAEVETKGRSGRRDGFFTQPLSTGQWLTYNIAPSPTQFASPESKRKQRDRALSIGEPQSLMSDEATATHNQAKEDALFRSVYSSFAPDRDDSGAVVAEQQKNRIWWRKYGESKYLDLLTIGDGVDEENHDTFDEEEIDEDELKMAIQNWKPEDDAEVLGTSKSSMNRAPENSQEADDLLQEISDLIETLDSHQRVRNLTAPTNARTVAGTPQLNGVSGSPTIPSSAELGVYEILEARLALIVSSLPPYLLSRLDGDRLGTLRISTKIQIESKNQRGTMEDGEVTATPRAKVAAPVVQSPSAYPAAPARSSSYLPVTTTPAQQYPRVGYPPSTARPPPASSYLQNPQYSNRPSNYPAGPSRSSYAPQTGYAAQPAPPSSVSRYNYGQQYGQHSQAAYGAYQNGYRPYSGQATNNHSYNSQYSTPQARPPAQSSQSSQSYRGSQTDYQQRPVPPQGYGYGSTQGGGSTSPQSQARSSYPPQSQGSGQRPPLHQQSSSGYQSQTPASTQVNGTVASNPSSESTAQPRRLSAEEQSAVMEKQKAQLAEQHSRQGSGTPQPANGQNGQEHGQQNGTPAPQQNGVIV